MTREEAIEILENGGWWDLLIPITTIEGRVEEDKLHEALDLAIAALRPVSREQVEKAWRGECDCTKAKACCTCCSMRCQYCIGQAEYKQASFCMKCGRPLTDEAVEMVMERLEALNDKDV